ncbi:MAG: IS110 family transposase [Oscillospiraceae bacterium]
MPNGTRADTGRAGEHGGGRPINDRSDQRRQPNDEYLESSRRGRVRACSTRQFPSPQLLASCAGLVPSNDESAGAVKSRSILPGNPHLKVILCQAAWIAVRSRTIPFSVT